MNQAATVPVTLPIAKWRLPRLLVMLGDYAAMRDTAVQLLAARRDVVEWDFEVPLRESLSALFWPGEMFIDLRQDSMRCAKVPHVSGGLRDGGPTVSQFLAHQQSFLQTHFGTDVFGKLATVHLAPLIDDQDWRYVVWGTSSFEGAVKPLTELFKGESIVELRQWDWDNAGGTPLDHLAALFGLAEPPA